MQEARCARPDEQFRPVPRKNPILSENGLTRATLCARLPRMRLIVILVVLLLLFGGGGYYMGPGVGYYGGGGVSLILLIVILFLFFGRGRSRL